MSLDEDLLEPSPVWSPSIYRYQMPPAETGPGECEVCGKNCRLVDHHDHFQDECNHLGDKYKVAVGRCARFENAAICNDCNYLCVEFKAAVQAPKFVSLSPEEMRLLRAGEPAKSIWEVKRHYYTPVIKRLIAKGIAREEFEKLCADKQKRLPSLGAVKPQRQRVLDAINSDPALADAIERADLEDVIAYTGQYCGNEHWGDVRWQRAELNSLAHLFYWKHVGHGEESMTFSRAFQNAVMDSEHVPDALDVFNRNLKDAA